MSVPRVVAILLFVALAGCATPPGPNADDAVSDFIAVSELEELQKVRFKRQYSYWRPVCPKSSRRCQ